MVQGASLTDNERNDARAQTAFTQHGRQKRTTQYFQAPAPAPAKKRDGSWRGGGRGCGRGGGMRGGKWSSGSKKPGEKLPKPAHSPTLLPSDGEGELLID